MAHRDRAAKNRARKFLNDKLRQGGFLESSTESSQQSDPQKKKSENGGKAS